MRILNYNVELLYVYNIMKKEIKINNTYIHIIHKNSSNKNLTFANRQRAMLLENKKNKRFNTQDD